MLITLAKRQPRRTHPTDRLCDNCTGHSRPTTSPVRDYVIAFQGTFTLCAPCVEELAR